MKLKLRINVRYTLILSLSVLFMQACHQEDGSGISRFEFSNEESYLIIQLLDDDLVNFQYGSGSVQNAEIEPTQMISDRVYQGVSYVKSRANTLETKELKLVVDQKTLAIKVIDKTKADLELSTIHPLGLEEKLKGIQASCTEDLVVYGLGSQFEDSLYTQISYSGKVRKGSEFGNRMMPWKGGYDSNTQIPVMYALEGAGFHNYALFFDNTYRHVWDFREDDSWNVKTNGGKLSFYLLSGPDLPDLRSDFMELTGTPPIPPKRMFGWWMSEYGYENWDELESDLHRIRSNQFPVDGFVLDLLWFGGIKKGDSQIGSFSWDLDNFPDPGSKIKNYWEEDGIGIMMMSEPFVDKKIPQFKEYYEKGFLVLDSAGESADIIPSKWWGEGGLIDYSNPGACTYIFDEKIKPLLDLGVFCHWMDLGEPEDFDPHGIYFDNLRQKDIHNLYNFLWIKCYHEGYKRHDLSLRPFFTTRSGTAGIQRFGAALWSGDIGTYMMSLQAHSTNQVNMSFSGIDYYRSDIGGYWRNMNDKGESHDELYTKWYAQSMLFEIPARPHCENPVNAYETAPDKAGHFKSNLGHTRMRYQWIPYLYSCAYQAYEEGLALMPPLAYVFQDDPNVLEISDQKMIGNALMGCADYSYGSTSKRIYLPAGKWYNWYTNEKLSSTGTYLEEVPLYRDKVYCLPVFAKEGAIIPMQYVDEETMNAEGRRKDNSIRNELIIRIFPSEEESTFLHYEDDNQTEDYKKGMYRLTNITQRMSEGGLQIQIEAARGPYDSELLRQFIVRIPKTGAIESVSLNGEKLEETAPLSPKDRSSASGWFFSENEMVIMTGQMNSSEKKDLLIQYN